MADYDLGTLRRGLVSIAANIAALETALAAERQKQREYERLIAVAEAMQGRDHGGSR